MSVSRRRITICVLAAIVALGGMAIYLRWVFDPFRLPWRDWNLYQRNFISATGRVIDTGNGAISHSEGQGYGLLIALAYNDRAAFDRIWRWTRENLQTRPNDKLLSWLWKPDENGGGAVADVNNASDGDLLVAWALHRAYQRWGDYDYEQMALQILVDLARLDVMETNQGLVLLPGTDGFVKEAGVTLNPSYYVFPALTELETAFPDMPWGEVGKAGLSLLKKARFGRWKLPADWVLNGENVIPAPNFPPLFGYNAVRVPLHLGWNNPRSELMQPFAKFWEIFPGKAMPATVNLETDEFGPHPALPGVRAIAAFAIACARNRPLTVREIPYLEKKESYFSASLKLLTKIALREASVAR